MSYQSPIEVIQTQMRSQIEVIQTQMRNQIEGEIYKAVMNVGVNVDKEELLKALRYDREQYQKGYKDRDDRIVRCKDCRHKGISYECILDRDLEEYGSHRTPEYDNWYCANGERKEEEP